MTDEVEVFTCSGCGKPIEPGWRLHSVSDAMSLRTSSARRLPKMSPMTVVKSMHTRDGGIELAIPRR
jgi:hypothetical protein